MNESIDLRSLEYRELVRKQLDVFAEVLGDVGVGGVFENKDILFDEYFAFGHYLKFNLQRENQNSVSLDFHLTSAGMRIDFEGYNEAFEFSEEDIRHNRSKVKELIDRLLCGYILVEYKGRALFVNLFDEFGDSYLVSSLGSFRALITGGYWKSKEISQHLFFPMYSKKAE